MSSHIVPVEVLGSVVAIFRHSRVCVAVLMQTNVAVQSDFIVVSSSYLVVPMLFDHGFEVLRVGHVAHAVRT